MTDILGAIDASISLAEKLHELISNFQDAPENARAHLLNSQLSNIRLDLLRGIALRTDFSKFTDGERQQAVVAVRDLRADLRNAIKCLKNSAPDDLVSRLLWAAWTGRGVTKLFNDIEGRFSALQSLFDLMRWSPSLVTLDREHFTIRSTYPDYKYITGAPMTQYCVQADYIAPDNTNRNQRRPLLNVFVESYRPGPVSDNRRNDQRYEAARTVAQFAAERLWWTRVSDNAAEVAHQTGVLPCIGFQDFRLIFLLPSNLDTSEDSTLRDLQPQTLTDCITTNAGVSLETRFSLALQLAEAVYKIHLAGLAHRAIRSNLILFLRPKAGSNLVTQSTPTAGNEAGEPSRVRRLSRRLTGRNDKPAAEVPGEPLRRTPSRTSMKNEKRNLLKRVASKTGLRKEAPEGIDPDLADKKRLEADTESSSGSGGPPGIPRSGKIPPGFGSLYLTGWNSANHCGSNRNPRTPKRSRDIFMHPDLQVATAFYMGHDIYSLGVCLIEIGMWNHFVEQEVPNERFGDLAAQAHVGGQGVDLMTVKRRINDFASSELPTAMGEGYAGLVKTCLTCLDVDGPWSNVEHEHVCERFREDVLLPLRSIVSGFGSWRLETTV